MIDRAPKPWTVWLARAADGGVRAMARSSSARAETHRPTAEEALAEVDRIMAARTRVGVAR